MMESVLAQVKADDGDLYNSAIAFVQLEKSVSTCKITNRFKCGYNRSARIIAALVEDGIIEEVFCPRGEKYIQIEQKET